MDVKHRIMTSLHDCRKKLDGGGRKMAFKISAAVAGKHTITEKWNRLFFFFLHIFFQNLKVNLPLTNTFITDHLCTLDF